MRLAVADVEHAAGGNEHAVRPGQRALQRIGLGTVAPRPVPSTVVMMPLSEVDSANDVVFGVGDVEGAARRRPGLWDRPASPAGRTAVAGVALSPGAGDVMNAPVSRSMR